MRKIYLILSIIICFILSLNSLEKDNIKILTLDNFILEACKNSHFEEILADELKLVYQEKLKIPAGDLILNVTGAYNFFYQDRAFHGFKGGISLSKLFALSGTSISAGYKTDPGIGNTQTSTINIQIEQSIIKDAFGRISRIKKKLAGYETEIARYQIIESYEEYLATIINLYFEWYSIYENLKISEKALNDSRNLYNNIIKKYNYNIALPIDVNKSELQLIEKEEQYINLKSSYDTIVFRIKTIINNNEDLVPQYLPLINESLNDFDLILDTFQKESRFAMTLDLLKKNSVLNYKIAFDDLLPNTKLYAGYSFKGSDYFFRNNRTHNLEAGITMDIPILSPIARNTYQLKKIELNQTNLGINNKIQDMSISLKELFYKLNSEIELIKTSDKKIKLSESIIKDELRDYNNGKSTMNDLISMYNTLYSNELYKINHIVLLNKNYIEWLRLTDSLVTDDKNIVNLNTK